MYLIFIYDFCLRCSSFLYCICKYFISFSYITVQSISFSCYDNAISSKEKRWQGKVKVKVTLIQALRLCTGRTVYRESRGMALLFHDHGTRRGWGVSVTPRPPITPGKNPALIVQETGWAPGPVGTGGENLGPTGIRAPDRPVRSQSLYRLSYPDHRWQDKDVS